MSRTFRRKDAHLTQGVSVMNYSKLYGWFGERNYYSSGAFTWELPTERALFEQWYKFHGDKERFFDAPPPYYRKIQIRKEKRNYKTQFQKWLNNPDFEIIEQKKMALNHHNWY